MIRRAARAGLLLALCALPLQGCGDDVGPSAPGAITGDEAQALADAEAMLHERGSVPAATAPAEAP